MRKLILSGIVLSLALVFMTSTAFAYPALPPVGDYVKFKFSDWGGDPIGTRVLYQSEASAGADGLYGTGDAGEFSNPAPPAFAWAPPGAGPGLPKPPVPVTDPHFPVAPDLGHELFSVNELTNISGSAGVGGPWTTTWSNFTDTGELVGMQYDLVLANVTPLMDFTYAGVDGIGGTADDFIYGATVDFTSGVTPATAGNPGTGARVDVWYDPDKDFDPALGPGARTSFNDYPTVTNNVDHVPGHWFTTGIDGQPGVAGVDDDGDGTVDNDTEYGWAGSDDMPINDVANQNSSLWLAAEFIPAFGVIPGTIGISGQANPFVGYDIYYTETLNFRNILASRAYGYMDVTGGAAAGALDFPGGIYWSEDNVWADLQMGCGILWTDDINDYLGWTVGGENPVKGQVVPEPCTMLLVGFGLLGTAAFGRKRKKVKM